MSLMAMADQVATSVRMAATSRAALDQLGADPALAREAIDTLVDAGGGIASVQALQEAATPGGVLLRDAWTGARDAADGLRRAAGAADDANRGAVTMAAAHAGSASELLDGFVFGGGTHFSIDGLVQHVGRQLDGVATQAGAVHVQAPRIPRPWEW